MTTHTQNLKISANKLAHICTFRCLPIKSFTNFKGLLSVVSRLYTSSFTCSFLSNCWHDCCLNIWISMCRSIQRASWVIVEEDSSKWPLGISPRKRPRRIRSDISDTVAERKFDTLRSIWSAPFLNQELYFAASSKMSVLFSYLFGS